MGVPAPFRQGGQIAHRREPKSLTIPKKRTVGNEVPTESLPCVKKVKLLTAGVDLKTNFPLSIKKAAPQGRF